MEEQKAKEKEAMNKQLQQVITQKTVLAELVKTQQKFIDDLLETSTKIVMAMQNQESLPSKNASPTHNKTIF